MAAPIHVLSEKPAITGTFNVSDAVGRTSLPYSHRGADGGEWFLNNNGGWAYRLWTPEDGLRAVAPFADSGTLPFISGSAFRPHAARFWSDDVGGFDPATQTPVIVLPGYGGNLNWQAFNVPQINSGIRWVLPADQRKRYLFASMSKYNGEFQVKTRLTGARSSALLPEQTIAITGGGNRMFAWDLSWRGIDAGEQMEIEIRKTSTGVGEVGVEFMYMLIPEAPARAKGFSRSLAHRAAFGGRNE